MARNKVELPRPLCYSLSDDGMGVVERAGLAGLYLTLQGVDAWATDSGTDTGEQARALKSLFQRSNLTEAAELILDWNSDDSVKPLTELVKWAWQVREGVFFLPGIHRTLAERNNTHLRVPIHNAILSTFLQHNKTRPKVVSPKGEDAVSIKEIDEGRTIEIPRYPVIVESYNGKANPPKQQKEVERILASKEAKLSSAYYPGIAPRFAPDRGWTGPAHQALLLLFVPIGCLYLELPRNRITLKQGKRQPSPNWAVVIPDIIDLVGYGKAWPQFHVRLQERFEKIKCKSLEDAVLRVAMEYATRPAVKAADERGAAPTLFVFCMGRTSYQRKDNSLSRIQMVRKQIVHISPQQLVLRRYQKLMAYMDNKIVPIDVQNTANESAATHRIRTLSGRGRIAENLVYKKAWYSDLLIPTDWERDTLDWERDRYNESHDEKISSQRLWFDHVCRKPEKEALMALAKDPSMYDDPGAETVFRKVIHDMMATLFWKETEAIKNRSGLKEDDPKFKEKLDKRWEDLVEDLQRSLAEAQTRDLFRRALISWLTKGGNHTTIREHHKPMWDFVNHRYDWQKARDLALLSIITYESRSGAKGGTGQ